MARALRPGPASLEGLRWLARVGPAPLDAWRCAMGWSEVAARSHARRLENERWLARYPMTRGEGSLFVATRTGVRVLGLPLRPAGPPGPTWWAHHCGCAWTAAWLRVPDRRFMGDRELLDDPRWSGQTTWSDFRGYHHGRHRPDIVGLYPNGEGVPIEVELQQKSLPRLRGILSMYTEWRFDRGIGGVIYVCGNQDGADRIRRAGAQIGLVDRLRIELLETITAQAIEACERIRTVRKSRGADELQPTGDRSD